MVKKGKGTKRPHELHVSGEGAAASEELHHLGGPSIDLEVVKFFTRFNVNTHQTHQTHQCAEVAISATTCAGPAIWPIASTTSVSSDPGSGGASSISLLCRVDRAMARSCGFLMSLSHHTRFPVTG
eukprot:COSAG06_NODE_1996_length_7886_cov_6.036985_7_plen_126_part_00